MKQIWIIGLLILCCNLLIGNTAFAINKTNSLLIYVNLLVGTFNFGNTYPEAQIPFRGIQISLNSSRTSHNQTFATELNYFLS